METDLDFVQANSLFSRVLAAMKRSRQVYDAKHVIYQVKHLMG